MFPQILNYSLLTIVSLRQSNIRLSNIRLCSIKLSSIKLRNIASSRLLVLFSLALILLALKDITHFVFMIVYKEAKIFPLWSLNSLVINMSVLPSVIEKCTIQWILGKTYKSVNFRTDFVFVWVLRTMRLITMGK